MSSGQNRVLFLGDLGVDRTKSVVLRWADLLRPSAFLLDRCVDANHHLVRLEAHKGRLASICALASDIRWNVRTSHSF